MSGSRIEVVFAKTDPFVMYAGEVANGQINLWKSTDTGLTFTQAAAPPVPTSGDRNCAVYVDPGQSLNVLVGGNGLYRSTDGGLTSTQIFSQLPPGINDLSEGFSSASSRCVFIATDRGLYRAIDFTSTALDNWNNRLHTPDLMSFGPRNIGVQRWACSTLMGTYSSTSISGGWLRALTLPSGQMDHDTTSASHAYGVSTLGRAFSTIDGGATYRYIYNTGANPILDAETDAANKQNALCLDPNDPNRLYVCGRRLWRTVDARSATPDWFAVKDEIPPDGGPLIDGNDPRNLSAVAVAKGNSDLIMAGHNNGQLFRTTDGTFVAPTWVRVDTPAMPKRWISRIVFDPLNPNRVFVCFLGWESGNLWRSMDGGATWSDVSTGMLPMAPVHTVGLSRLNGDNVLVGTEVGLFASDDGGGSWSATTEGPGAVSIRDIVWTVSSTELWIVATRGNQIFAHSRLDGTIDYESPQFMSVIAGRNFIGDLVRVFKDDDRMVSAQPDFSGARLSPQVDIEFKGYVDDRHLFLNGAFLGGSSSKSFSYCIAVYNYTTGSWMEGVRQRPSASSFYFGAGSTHSMSSGVRGPNGEVRVRVRFYFDASAGRNDTVAIDRVQWISGNQ